MLASVSLFLVGNSCAVKLEIFDSCCEQTLRIKQEICKSRSYSTIDVSAISFASQLSVRYLDELAILLDAYEDFTP